MKYEKMLEKIGIYEKLQASIETKKRMLSNLEKSRHSSYDRAFLTFDGNSISGQDKLDTESIDLLIEKYEKDIEKLVEQKDELGMD